MVEAGRHASFLFDDREAVAVLCAANDRDLIRLIHAAPFVCAYLHVFGNCERHLVDFAFTLEA